MLLVIGLFFSLFGYTQETFRRTNSFCNLENQKIEFSIKATTSNVEPQDKKWGQWIFTEIKTNPKDPIILPDNFSFRMKFFPKKSPQCTNSFIKKIADQKFMQLLLKDNRPKKETLFIQIFDLKNKTNLFIDTNMDIHDPEEHKDGVTFETNLHDDSFYMTKAQFEGQSFLIQSRSFIQRMLLKENSITVDEVLTFEKSPWKPAFKDLNDFLVKTGWDKEKKSFVKSWVNIAVSHKTKKRCILFSDTQVKPKTIDSNWQCI